MYRLGHKQAHHYLWYVGTSIAIIGVIVVGMLVVRHAFRANTVIKQSAAVVRHVAGDQTSLQQVKKSVFALALPADWTAVRAPNVAYAVYSWAGIGQDSASRRLDVYVDATPANLAVNRLLPVQANGDHIDLVGTVSDNCTTFTDQHAASPATGTAPSVWGGVHFLCDMANYERDIVAIGSTEAINTVTPTGMTAGTHHILLVYTDNSINPDYTILTAIVKSFHLI